MASFIGFCYVCSEDTIFEANRIEAESFRCVRCNNPVRIESLPQETYFTGAAA